MTEFTFGTGDNHAQVFIDELFVKLARCTEINQVQHATSRIVAVRDSYYFF